MNKMCSLLGINCNEEDLETKILEKVKHEKALNYDEQKKYIKILEDRLRKCEKKLSQVVE